MSGRKRARPTVTLPDGREVIKPAVELHRCANCKAWFWPQRSDQTWCDAGCRASARAKALRAAS